MNKRSIFFLALFVFASCLAGKDVDAFIQTQQPVSTTVLAPVAVSDNGKYLLDINGQPFFGLAIQPGL